MRYLKGTLSVVVFFLTLAVGYAQSSAELRKQREQLNKEIERLNQRLKTTSSDRSLPLKEVTALNTHLRFRQKKISTISSELNLIRNQIATHNKPLQILRSQLEKLRKKKKEKE